MQSPPQLMGLDDAMRLEPARNLELHRKHLNPRLANLSELIGADIPLTEASGMKVWDAKGVCYLDFVSGYAALNLGHNHPDVDAALDRVKRLVNLVEGPSQLTAALAQSLTGIAPEGLVRVLFANSGSEVVDAALKLARAATGRTGFIACAGGFHGRTVGALSINGRSEFRRNFEPLLGDVQFVPFGDSAALGAALAGNQAAGFIVEPVQGEGGIRVPPEGYLREARELCSKHGTLLIADEIQTGLGRTGKMFAVEHSGIIPDVLLLGKALGGGAVPISAILTTEKYWKDAKGGTPESPFQFPTFGGNTRACAAGLATLEILYRNELIERAATLGDLLLVRLTELKERQPLIAAVRGMGLMAGIEFAPATKGLATALTAGILNRLSHDYFAGLVLLVLRQDHHMLTLNTLNDPNVLRVQPPLIVSEEEIEAFVEALDEVLSRWRGFPNAAVSNWQLFAKAQGV